MKRDGSIKASVNVTNTGTREASEVVQLYIRDLVGSISRPVKELKDFARITLKPGETRTVEFTITADKLKFYNSELQYDCEPGEFDLMIGPNSRDVETLRFTLQ
jgi:beta-glucosidase